MTRRIVVDLISDMMRTLPLPERRTDMRDTFDSRGCAKRMPENAEAEIDAALLSRAAP